MLLMSAVSCVDEAPRYTIPYASVNFEVNVKGLDHQLNAALSYKIFTENDRRRVYDRFGYSGLLVISDATGDNLFAYDLCCPFEDRKDVVVTPTNDGKAVCSTCGSLFVTMYGMGSVESGPSPEPLQTYSVIPQAGGVFIVRN